MTVTAREKTELIANIREHYHIYHQTVETTRPKRNS
jgi:hypothetical protein